MKRQIGNAVPPRMGKVLMREVLKALEESDKKDAVERSSESPPGEGSPQIINVDELNDSDLEITGEQPAETPLPVRGPTQFIYVDEWNDSDMELPAEQPVKTRQPGREPPQIIDGDGLGGSGVGLGATNPPAKEPPHILDVDELNDLDLEITGEQPAEKPLQQPSRWYRDQRAFGAPRPHIQLSSSPTEKWQDAVILGTPEGSPVPSSSPSPQQSTSPSSSPPGTQYHAPFSKLPSPLSSSTIVRLSLPQQHGPDSELEALGESFVSSPRPPHPGIPRRRRRAQAPFDDEDLPFPDEAPTSPSLQLSRSDTSEAPRQLKRAKVTITVEDYNINTEGGGD